MIPRRMGLTPGNMDPETAVLPTLPSTPEANPQAFQLEQPSVTLPATPDPAGDSGQRFVLSPASSAAPANVPKITPPRDPAVILDQLQQLRTLTHVSNLRHPELREFFRAREMATGAENHMVIAPRGIVYLADFGLL